MKKRKKIHPEKKPQNKQRKRNKKEKKAQQNQTAVSEAANATQSSGSDNSLHKKKKDKWNCNGRLCCRSRRRDQLLYPTISRYKHHHFFPLFLFLNTLCWGVLFRAEAAAPPPSRGCRSRSGASLLQRSLIFPRPCAILSVLLHGFGFVFFSSPLCGYKGFSPLSSSAACSRSFHGGGEPPLRRLCRSAGEEEEEEDAEDAPPLPAWEPHSKPLPLAPFPSLENRALGGVCDLEGFVGFFGWDFLLAFFFFFLPLNKWKAELSLMEMDEAGLAALLRRGHGTDGISDLSQAVGEGISPPHRPSMLLLGNNFK
ncbi:uncharacterized protein LOC120496799 [Passer montanus]|uniref:uncharacterized protein LOC120496799 n=1 Tax=Passer montanus TaxID=9160 RepID=UPI001960DDBD|nr:uncharacterized protein LOC120496799 [Passer montanus]XP_039553508.1 uncharacterized protein LOC120496799 [Passer montanus]XP_039553509.1 uncharacterized protein LOC120496799 [Passer montanus]XP_039553511.1 uncharacterized protein LOC120496799 [Passer montanus]XP_039553512.1 uncharacterized protein LOC120496799 [Passer montanus]XP_039553513.1 uncharacterized protein LOC120496799 [Passer montanus]